MQLAADAWAVLSSHPYYVAAVAFFLCSVILIADTGDDVPLLFPLRAMFSGPYRPTKEYARLASKYLIRR